MAAANLQPAIRVWPAGRSMIGLAQHPAEHPAQHPAEQTQGNSDALTYLRRRVADLGPRDVRAAGLLRRGRYRFVDSNARSAVRREARLRPDAAAVGRRRRGRPWSTRTTPGRTSSRSAPPSRSGTSGARGRLHRRRHRRHPVRQRQRTSTCRWPGRRRRLAGSPAVAVHFSAPVDARGDRGRGAARRPRRARTGKLMPLLPQARNAACSTVINGIKAVQGIVRKSRLPGSSITGREVEDAVRVTAQRRGDLLGRAARGQQRLLERPGVVLDAGHPGPVGTEDHLVG